LSKVFENSRQEQRQRDNEMVEIRNKYEKAIILIQQMVRYSYRIALKEKTNRDKFEDLTNDIEIFMPHF
jgi:hypothetical protein